MDLKQKTAIVYNKIKRALENNPVDILMETERILVKYEEVLLCSIHCLEGSFSLSDISDSWKGETTYSCQQSKENRWYYVTNSLDECIGEVQRLVRFETENMALKDIEFGEIPPFHWEMSKDTMLKVTKEAFTRLLKGTDCYVLINGEPGDKNVNPSKKQFSVNLYAPEGMIVRLWPHPQGMYFDVVIQKAGYKSGRVPSTIAKENPGVTYEVAVSIVKKIALNQ